MEPRNTTTEVAAGATAAVRALVDNTPTGVYCHEMS